MNPPRLALLLLTTLSLLTACSRTTPCDDCDCATPATTASSSTSPASSISVATEAPKPSEASRKFPLKGVITDLLPDRSALMVKHEAIPGVMKAMTMLFTVDPSVLTTVKKGDAITARMSRRDDEWFLDEVKVITPAR